MQSSIARRTKDETAARPIHPPPHPHPRSHPRTHREEGFTVQCLPNSFISEEKKESNLDVHPLKPAMCIPSPTPCEYICVDRQWDNPDRTEVYLYISVVILLPHREMTHFHCSVYIGLRNTRMVRLCWCVVDCQDS